MRSRSPSLPAVFSVRGPAAGSSSVVALTGLAWIAGFSCFHSKAHADALPAPEWAFVMPGSDELRVPLAPAPPGSDRSERAGAESESGGGSGAGKGAPAARKSKPSAISKSLRRAELLALFYKAGRLELEENPEAALPVYLQVMADAGLTPEVYSKLMGLYTAMERWDDALALGEKYVAKFPASPEPLLGLSSFLESHAAHAPDWNSRAIQTAKLAAKKFPESSQAVHRLVRLYLAAQDRAKAQAVVETALNSKSKDAGFWLSLSTAARNAFPLDDKETQEKHFALVSRPIEKALTLAKDTPADGAVLAAAADFYARTRHTDLALPLYERAAALRPGDLMARRKLGQCLRMAGRDADAVKEFESLVAIDSADTVAHEALVSLYETSDPVKALQHRAEVLRLEGGDPDDYAAAADELLKTNLPVEALTLLKRGIFYNPKAGQLYALLARTLDARSEFTSALKTLEEAETLAAKSQPVPKWLDTGFYLQWAETARRAGKTPDAEARYRQAIEKAPREKPELAAPAYHSLGKLWLSENRNLDAAGELLRTATGLAPDEPLYLDTMGWFYLQKKEWPAAVSTLKKAVELSKGRPTPELVARLAEAEKGAGSK